jgi:hypothetical protein
MVSNYFFQLRLEKFALILENKDFLYLLNHDPNCIDLQTLQKDSSAIFFDHREHGF